MFKRLNVVSNDLFEVELVIVKIQRRELIIVVFFILQNPKLRMLELYFKFFDNFCVVDFFEELDMDTESSYLAPAHDNQYDRNLSSENAEWEALREDDSDDYFTAGAVHKFPGNCCDKHKKHDKR